MRILKAVALLFALLGAAPLAAQVQPGNPAGLWRCIVNSSVTSIDLYLQVAPNQTLLHQGSVVYVNTGRIYNVRGAGRWLLLPPDATANHYTFRFQIQPMDGNHAIFSIFAGFLGDPNFLGHTFVNNQTGQSTDTRCQRIG